MITEREFFAKFYRFSAEIRGLHWLRALLIFGLVATGFYLAKPFLTPSPALEPVNFQNALVRFWHVVFGFALAFVTIMRIFLFFFDEHSRRYERDSFRDTFSLTAWKQQLKYYLLLGPYDRQGAYGPLQHVGYMTLMVLLLLQIMTGMILHAANYQGGLGGVLGTLLGPLTVWLGGLAGVSNLHYIIMWVLIIFVPIHLYMVYWTAHRSPGSCAEPMFSGYSFKKIPPKS
ncbi:Ni/Fe-hydrogenase, b-type cytochrome subunit [Desulfurivibrio alkaliphilus]|uniref:Ni/Fe-hydrogenase, b-type cytochrome subunit n=1 Tax=Desulfurivibrio alkaliphilus (strain DSM 19089 / UNIQEM U267 / AHT2) TaxID=589865 RepID=D6Z225_DESAT|nr:Ni/Fe-hydrogenase, b-type cytochrome subunit [Desulfurivibrio alkaliphilus]ADH85600.1 Ni/Fe-hydrogenase, b-type cytochrome subunit [Desulfurivibrio alkaliphilus AHT 2]